VTCSKTINTDRELGAEKLKFDLMELQLQQQQMQGESKAKAMDVATFGLLNCSDNEDIYSEYHRQSPQHNFGVPHNFAAISTIRFAPM
jgi:hypothetical protein